MTDKSVVPEGMVVWHGGDGPPADFDPSKPIMYPDGDLALEEDNGGSPSYWHHSFDEGGFHDAGNIIAYTPKSNPLNLETSDLDPITPEEDALATAIIAAEGVTRQSLHGVVRAIRAGLAKAGAVIVPVEPTEAMVRAGSAAIEDIDQENVDDNDAG